MFNQEKHAVDSFSSRQQFDQDVNRSLALLILITVAVVGSSWLFSIPVYFDLKIALQISPVFFSAVLLFVVTRIQHDYINLISVPLGYLIAFSSWSYVIFLNTKTKVDAADVISAQMLGMSHSMFFLGLCLLILWLGRYFKFAIYLSSIVIVSLLVLLVVFSDLTLNFIIAAALILFCSAVIAALGFKVQQVNTDSHPVVADDFFGENSFLLTSTHSEEGFVPATETEINTLALNESSVTHNWELILKELHGELKNTSDVDQLFKRMLVFLNEALEYSGAAVGMLQHKSIKKIAQYGDDEYIHAQSLAWNNQKIKEVFSSRDPVLSEQNNLSSSRTDLTEPVHRLDVPIVSSNKVIGLVTIFREILLFDANDIRLASSIVFHSMVALKVARLQEELKRVSNESSSTTSTTKLTLYSREQFVEKIKPVLEKLNKPRECTIFIVEIDNHDEIVESHGREAGIAIHKAASSVIMSKLTDHDVFGNYGKEGFVILMDETDLNHGKERAEGIRQKVSQFKLKYKSGVLTTTVSIGLTIVSDQNEDLAALMRKADMGLFVAKENGGNTVKVSF